MEIRLPYFLTVITLLLTLGVQAQSLNVDSLEQVVSTSDTDTIVLKAAHKLIQHYYFNGDSTNVERIVETVKPQLNISHKYTALIYNYYCYHTFKTCKNTTEGKRLMFKSIAIQEELNLEEDLATSYLGLGIQFKRYALYEEALIYYHKAIEIFTKTKNLEGLGNVNNNIANIFSLIDSPEKSLPYHYKALEYRREINSQSYMNISYFGLGLAYKRLNNIDSAEYYFKKTIEESEKIEQYTILAKAYSSLGILYADNGEYDKADPFYQKALEIRLSQNDEDGAYFSKMNIGTFYLNHKFNPIVQTYCFESYTYAKKSGDLFLQRESCRCLYRFHIKTKNFSKAVEFMNEFIALNDSIISIESQTDLVTQEIAFEYSKKNAADSVAREKEKIIDRAKIEKQELEIKSSRTQKYMLFGGLALVLIFAFFMYNRYKVMQRQKGIIESQKLIVEEKNKEILDSINYAKRIQNAILPPDKLVKEYLQNSFILYKPKDIVAGDFYWMESVENKILFAAADCTGHGVPGAMVSVVCNNGLNRSVREHGLTDPGEILDKSREIVVTEFEKSEEEVKDGMDIALCCLEEKKLTYSGAHNPLWIIRKDSNKIEEIKADKQPIGKVDHPKKYTSHLLELNHGDTFYIFSDGYADQFGGEKGKKFKSANFKKLLLSLQSHSMEKQKELIDEAFEEWKGDLEQLDDVCIIGVRI